MADRMRSRIAGTGMFVPEHVVHNDRLSRVMDTSDEWIRQRTGIVERRFAAPDQATSDLAIPAARAALADAGLEVGDVDYVVFATMTPDHYFPGAGSPFSEKLGLGTVPCLDIRQQCVGFLFGLQLADALVGAGTAENVLLLGAEVHGGFMPWTSWDVVLGESDRAIDPDEHAHNTRFRDRTVLFGDGAGAVVVRRGDDGAGLIDCRIHTDGRHTKRMWVDGGGSAYRPYVSAEMLANGAHVPIVEGRDVFKMAVTLLPEAILGLLGDHGLGVADVDLLVMHQANLRINEAVQKRLEIPDDRVFNNIQRYGNTTAATIPMAYHEAIAERPLGPGRNVVFAAVGSGLSWGAALYRT